MNGRFRTVRNAVYSGLVAVSLVLGASAAVAAPGALACTDPDADGSCTSNKDCQEVVCQGGAGGCRRGCCYCEFSPAG